jgi:choice-of-anchor B domain-containing protein
MHKSTVINDVKGYEAVTGGEVKCENDKAADFDCKGVTLMSYLPVQAIGGARGIRVNDIWGWTDPQTRKEYALVGRTDGTSFVDVTDPHHPRYLGDLPKTEGSRSSVWRDIKVYKDHAFIVADGAGPHGMQVFDLTRLRNPGNEPALFEADFVYEDIASAHNVVINESTGFAYAVGSSSGGTTCGGGLHMIDIHDPKNPVFEGCFADASTGRSKTGYSHDAQCVVYQGPDAEHQNKEICFGSNETALSIADVTDKENPVALAMASYPKVVYTHQGWLTEDQRYFYMNDEGDEPTGAVEGTRTLVWDVSDLDDPILVKEHIASTTSTDHNLYIRGNLMYQSNYDSGFRILDISTPDNPTEVGFLDTVPAEGGGGGSWSNYPYFESGTIIVTSMREGLFVVKKEEVAF